jgi:hypothetical protein
MISLYRRLHPGVVLAAPGFACKPFLWRKLFIAGSSKRRRGGRKKCPEQFRHYLDLVRYDRQIGFFSCIISFYIVIGTHNRLTSVMPLSEPIQALFDIFLKNWRRLQSFKRHPTGELRPIEKIMRKQLENVL